MKDMLANLPQFQEQREKVSACMVYQSDGGADTVSPQFSLHLTMAQECMDIFERAKLPAIATVEQNCATGLTAEGKTPKHLVEEMVPLLDSRDVQYVARTPNAALTHGHPAGTSPSCADSWEL